MRQEYIRDMAENSKAHGCGTELTEELYQCYLKEMGEAVPGFIEYLLQNGL